MDNNNQQEERFQKLKSLFNTIPSTSEKLELLNYLNNTNEFHVVDILHIEEHELKLIEKLIELLAKGEQ
jgi:hypothetical protein